jgi:hypothetical protein
MQPSGICGPNRTNFLHVWTRAEILAQIELPLNCDDTRGSADGSGIVTDSPCGESIAWTSAKGNKMKTQSIYAKSMLQAQGSTEQPRKSSMSLGKRLAIAIVSLAILSVGMWVGIEQALRATSGAR